MEKSKFVKYPVIGGCYKHYKGGLYKVLFLSIHSESGEVLVNYQSLIFGSYHSRPLEMWFELVPDLDVTHYSEKIKVQRFKLINEN